MISPAAKKEFLERELDDFSWIKDLSQAELDTEIALLSSVPVFKLAPYKHQKACFLLGVSISKFLFLLDMGLGKAQPLTSKILTPTGWKIFKDIEIGDTVCTPDGGISYVTAVHEQGKKDIYEILFTDGSLVRCCKEHLWSVFTPPNKKYLNRHKLKKLEDIHKDLTYASPSGGINNNKQFIPMTNPVNFKQTSLLVPKVVTTKQLSKILNLNYFTLLSWESKGWLVSSTRIGKKKNSGRIFELKKVLECLKNSNNKKINKVFLNLDILKLNKNLYWDLDPYIVGLLLGDGGLTQSITFTSVDDEILEVIRKSLPEDLLLYQDSIYGYRISSGRNGNTNSWLHCLRYFSLFGCDSYDKHIPKEYLFSSIENRISVLQGLMDTDGWVSKKGSPIQYTTVSDKLAEDFRFLVQSLGGIVRHSSVPATREGRYAHTFTIRLPETIKPFRLSRKLNRLPKKQKYGPSRAIKNINRVGEEEARCITIEDPKGLYITDDFVVTHNSKIVLDIANYRKKENQVKKGILIIALNEISVENWADEIYEHVPDMTYQLLIGEKEEKLSRLDTPSDIYVTHYMGLQSFMSKAVKKNKKNKRVLDPNKAKEFARMFDFVIFDESHTAKNSKTLTYTLCNIIAKATKYSYALTGTPFGRDPIDLWTQFYLIDSGATLGKHKGIYQESYFNKKLNTFTGWFDYVFNTDLEKLLHKTIQNSSIRYEEKECGDVPELIRKIIPVYFPVDTYKYYKIAVEKIKKEHINLRELESAFITMRQISSGFIGLKGEDGEKVEIEFKQNPKLKALEDLIESFPENRKMIIFHDFIKSGGMIRDLLKKKKLKYASLWSGTKNSGDELRKFKTDKQCRFFVVNSKSGSASLNLQVANYLVYFESPVPVILRQQSEKRCSGARQKKFKRVFMYDLVMVNSVDKRILDFHKEGKSLFDALVDGKEIDAL